MFQPRHTPLALICVALAAPALAAEQGVTRARLELDKVERELKNYETIDVARANKLIKKVNKAVGYLKGCKDRSAADWQTQAKRSQELDKAVRAKIKGASPSTEGAPAEPDATTLAAKKSVDAVEKELPKLAPGDTKNASRLVKKLNAARKTLSKSDAAHRQHPLWNETVKRSNALDKQIRARAKEKPAAKPDSGKPTGGEDPQAKKRTLPFGTMPPDQPPMSPRDRVAWRRYFAGLERNYTTRAARDPRKVGRPDQLDAELRLIKNQRANLAKRIGAQAHPRVKWAKEVIDATEAMVKKQHAEGKKQLAEAKAAAEKEAGDVEAELREIEAFFDKDRLDCVLKPPFPAPKVEEWLKKLADLEALAPKGLALVEKFKQERPRYAKLPRVRKLEGLFKRGIPNNVKRGVERTALHYTVSNSTHQGEMTAQIGFAQRLLDYTAKGIKESNLASDKWVKDSLQTIDDGIMAANAKQMVLEKRFNKRDPKLMTLMVQLRQLRTKLADAAKRLLADTRMPAADSTDAKLLALAKSTVKRAKWDPSSWKRVVINRGKKRHEQRMREAREDGRYLRIWKWTEVWEDFQVCAAEEVEGELRLVYYTLKYLHVGPPWKTTKTWYVRGRIVSRRILPENVNK